MANFDNFDVKSQIISSTQDTFETMLSMPVSVSEAQPPEQTGKYRLVGTINFAGDVSGIVNIRITSDFGFQMAAGMLGIGADAVESINEVKGLLTEITNIVGGSIKASLNDAGFPCVISTPAITYGSDFTIISQDMDRYERYVFVHEDETIIIEADLQRQAASEEGAEFGLTDIAGRLQAVDVEKINALDYAATIEDALIETFDAMLSMDLRTADSIPSASLEGLRNVASVCFGGDATGIISLQVSDAFSRMMAASMLGMEPEEIEGLEEIVDFLGELSHIVGASLQSALADAGLDCALSTPALTTGSDFEIESLNLERYERFAYKHDTHTVLVEIGIKISDLATVADQSAEQIHFADTEAQTAPATGAESPPTEAPAPPSADDVVGEPPSTPVAETGAEGALGAAEDFNLEMLMDIPLEITVELGRTRIRIRDLLHIEPGSAVKLSRLEGEPVDILANDTLIAKGEVVVQNEKYGIRITEITSRMDRIRNLR